MNRFVALAPAGLLAFATAALVLSTGCGTEISTSGSTGTGGSTSTATAATSTGSAPGTSGSGAGGGAICGGISGTLCAATEFCDFPDNTCGSADGQGVCTKRPEVCDTSYTPTCGCDGKIYAGLCAASGAGQDISDLGGCPAPVGMFGCGAAFCDPKTQYCQAQLSDVGSEPSTYACVALPAACGGGGTCACLTNAPCGQTCAVTTDGGLKVSCPGG
jgi:hypothetical protein